jgi:hypothetical protein
MISTGAHWSVFSAGPEEHVPIEERDEVGHREPYRPFDVAFMEGCLIAQPNLTGACLNGDLLRATLLH